MPFPSRRPDRGPRGWAERVTGGARDEVYAGSSPGVHLVLVGRAGCGGSLGAMTSRWVDVDGMSNVRDLGGLPVEGGVTARGVVLRGETVVHLTPAGAQRLHDLRVRHVLDLREPEERLLDGDGVLGPAYQRSDVLHEAVPLAMSDIAADPVGRERDELALADRYTRYLDNGAFRLADALARTAWSTSGLYIHCAVGKDRTGVVSALLLSLAGASDDVDRGRLCADGRAAAPGDRAARPASCVRPPRGAGLGRAAALLRRHAPVPRGAARTRRGAPLAARPRRGQRDGAPAARTAARRASRAARGAEGGLREASREVPRVGHSGRPSFVEDSKEQGGTVPACAGGG